MKKNILMEYTNEDGTDTGFRIEIKDITIFGQLKKSKDLKQARVKLMRKIRSITNFIEKYEKENRYE